MMIPTCWVTIARRWWLAQVGTDVSERSAVVDIGRARCFRPRTPENSPGDSGRARPKCWDRSTGSLRRPDCLRLQCTEDRPVVADAGTRSTTCRPDMTPDTRCCSAKADCSVYQTFLFRATWTIGRWSGMQVAFIGRVSSRTIIFVVEKFIFLFDYDFNTIRILIGIEI